MAPKARTAALNPYAYCENNPLGFVDPSGLRVQYIEPAIDGGSLASDTFNYFNADPKERDKLLPGLICSYFGTIIPGVSNGQMKAVAKLGDKLSMAADIKRIETGSDLVEAAGKARNASVNLGSAIQRATSSGKRLQILTDFD